MFSVGCCRQEFAFDDIKKYLAPHLKIKYITATFLLCTIPRESLLRHCVRYLPRFLNKRCHITLSRV
jgi:hypothetical protein